MLAPFDMPSFVVPAALAAALQPLPVALRHEVLACLHPQRVSARTACLRAGQRCNEIFYVQRGLLRHHYHTEQREVTRWLALPGTFTTCLSSFLGETPSPECIEALQPTELYVLSHADWQELHDRHEPFRQFWHQGVVASFRAAEELLLALQSRPGKERYAFLEARYPGFIQQVPQKHLASLLGIEPRHLSRIRRERGRPPK